MIPAQPNRLATLICHEDTASTLKAYCKYRRCFCWGKAFHLCCPIQKHNSTLAMLISTYFCPIKYTRMTSTRNLYGSITYIYMMELQKSHLLYLLLVQRLTISGLCRVSRCSHQCLGHIRRIYKIFVQR